MQYEQPKKIVFISHITEEKELAKIIEDQIKTSFLGLLGTFVSSSDESLPAGRRWLEEIDSALSNSAIQISLCSPSSVKRPWINFEAGAAWIRKIPVIPLCHSGLSKSDLPIPLSLLQASDLNNESDLNRMFKALADVMKGTLPTINYPALIEKCNSFTLNYNYFNIVNNNIKILSETDEQLKQLFHSGKIPAKEFYEIEDYKFHQIIPALEKLKELGVLTFRPSGGIAMSEAGIFKTIKIELTQKYHDELRFRVIA